MRLPLGCVCRRRQLLTFVFAALLLRADIKGPLIQSDKGVNRIPNLIQPSQTSFNYTSQTSMRRSGGGTERWKTSRELLHDHKTWQPRRGKYSEDYSYC